MNTTTHTTDSAAETQAPPIHCLACGGSMYRARCHFADGLSTVPHITHAALECEDCGEYMHVDDAILSEWATQEEIDRCPSFS